MLVILSGGMDSGILMYEAINSEYEVEAIGFNYGQRHVTELDYAKRLCDDIDICFDIVDIQSITPFIGGSALTDDIEVPKGHYEDLSMKATVVPNRNAIMLSIAFGIAKARGFGFVGAGMHAGDHAVYPDCRPEFVNAFQSMQLVAMDEPVTLWTPWIGVDKTHIAKRGFALGFPFEESWSCYEGKLIHCGECGTCVERKEAIGGEGNDPTEYYA